ncbi:hypothetical protein OI18_22685 [Flavihumibacter solisilvae]|uniref:Uncharacterized protein n=2 Tax=Flavihumibacter solisilvae TaxID=1349421 RepID=A0A0C1IJU2_9BACT|nr:hypothetical protein OI18_22685 [Flavihumibacter solisilvae]
MLLVSKQAREMGKFYVLAALAMLGMIILSFIFFFILLDGPHYREQTIYNIYATGLLVGGALFGSIAFTQLAEKEKGMYWLSFPASHAEKMATTILYTSIGFLLVYTASFMLIKWIAVGFVKTYLVGNSGRTYQEAIWHPQQTSLVFQVMFAAYFGIQALFVLGSVYFGKYSFIKTIIASVVFAGVFIYVMYKSYSVFLPEEYSWSVIEMKRFFGPDNIKYEYYSVSKGLRESLIFLVKWAWAPIFWFITWTRLKEKQI